MTSLHEYISAALNEHAVPDYKGTQCGYIISDNGTVMRACGIQAPIGHTVTTVGDPETVCAEVVGFGEGCTILAPLKSGISLKPGSAIIYREFAQRLSVDSETRGQIIDGLARPLSGRSEPHARYNTTIDPTIIMAQTKISIEKPMTTGIRTIDALMPLGQGQRMGLMSGSGVGKSSLLGMMARQAHADVIIVALIGERGREIADFIEHKLPEENRHKSLIIAAPADQTPAHKIRAAFLAHSLALHHAQKKKRVFLIMDSLTRVAHASREIGISVGEPAIARGYPPSTFSMLAKLIEAGGAFSGGGSITSLYTVLVDGDDPDDPILDSARSLLDGHIILNRSLAEQGHYPAIDIARSLSRIMDDICSKSQISAARKFRSKYYKMNEVAELRSVGLYQAGNDNEADMALAAKNDFINFLQQEEFCYESYETSLQKLYALSGDTP